MEIIERKQTHTLTHGGKDEQKLTFCVRHLEEKKLKQFVLSMRKQETKTQLIVTRMCND